MALTNVVRRLTPSELARQPKNYGLVAYLDGWGQATGLPPMTYLRRLSVEEARQWREGWAEGHTARSACAAPLSRTKESHR
jgi:hypothetical protein